LAEVPDVPPGVVTVMSIVPADPAGLVAVTEFAESAVMLPVAEPNLTEEAADKLVPVMVTDDPPVVAPTFGATLVTVGRGT
jgi:hypothetical protein